MTFSEKLLGLRKARNMSQEELAECLEVSRQAVSRWEMGTAMPDAVNILAISKLFEVTTDYLLYDEMERAEVPHAVSAPQEKGTGRKFSNAQYLLTGMVLIQVVLSLLSIWGIAKDWLILHVVELSVFETIRMGSLQLLAVISFELFFSKRNMPDIDHGLYHALFYRVSIWNIAFIALYGVIHPLFRRMAGLLFQNHPKIYRILALGEWNAPLPWGVVLPFLMSLLIYAAVCLTVFFLCRRIIKRHRT